MVGVISITKNHYEMNHTCSRCGKQIDDPDSAMFLEGIICQECQVALLENQERPKKLLGPPFEQLLLRPLRK